jgi:hypothetical protein
MVLKYDHPLTAELRNSGPRFTEVRDAGRRIRYPWARRRQRGGHRTGLWLWNSSGSESHLSFLHDSARTECFGQECYRAHALLPFFRVS